MLSRGGLMVLWLACVASAHDTACALQIGKEAQQALVAADGLSRDSGKGEVKEDTEKPEGPELTVENILAHAVRVDAEMQAARAAMGAQSPSCDILPNDGVALLATSDLADAEIILESGTANGRSTELMARFFAGRKKALRITTVDLGGGTGCAAHLADTHKRLRQFDNVRAIIGDSFKEFPKLIRKHQGKRIGLFIDGPKGHLALKLCMKMLKLSQDILYCLFHDYLPDGYDWGTKDHKGYHYLQVSGRKVMLTCCDKKWLKHFGLQYARNSSIGLAAGTRFIPWGVTGDV